MVRTYQDFVVTGAGYADPDTDGDPKPLLKTPKMKRLMGPWDGYAILAAAEAVESSGLPRVLGESAGLFVCVGHVPLQDAIMSSLLEDSLNEDGTFNDKKYSKGGYLNFNPLWVFRSLTNAPSFFVSSCFDIQGPYFVTFSEPGQFYLNLEEAMLALDEGRCEVALVGATADQDNSMVRFHYQRIPTPTPESDLRSGAGFLMIEKAEHAAARGAKVLAKLEEFEVGYRNFDPRESDFPHEEAFEPAGPCSGAYWGPGSLAMTLAKASAGSLSHTLSTRDGIQARSRWEVLS